MPYDDYAPLNTLCEFNMIAGTEYILDYTVYEEDGVTLFDLTGCSAYLLLCPYGNFALKVAQKSANVTGMSTFEVKLETDDTLGLAGKYIQQPLIIDADGNSFYPSQGVILIQNRIPN